VHRRLSNNDNQGSRAREAIAFARSGGDVRMGSCRDGQPAPMAGGRRERSTWYRRGNRIGQALRKSPQIVRIIPYPDLSRASAFVAQLQCELAEVARCNAIAAAIIGK